MNIALVLAMLPFWILCLFWFLPFSSEARMFPAQSPFYDPVVPIDIEPGSPIMSQMVPQASAVEVVHRQDSNKKISTLLVISSSLLGVSVFLLLLIWYRTCRKRKFNTKSVHVQDSEKGNSLSSISSKSFSLRTAAKKGSVASLDYPLLVAATNNFQEDNLLNEDTYGCVYKAQFDTNLLAAVKKVDSVTLDADREFKNEVDWLSKLSHHNIVSLLGYCVQGDSRFLVHEMMHNGSLESHLHGPTHGSNLSWHLRMKIALDIARGLEFLHERCNPPVIHRDLNSSNILLDLKFNAKLSAFGRALVTGSRLKENLKISEALGYFAPECVLDGKHTDKSDVYAFGVILLELLTGRKPAEWATSAQQLTVVTWAMPQLSDRSKLPYIVDPAIRDTMDLKHLYQVAAIAVLCVQPEPSYRPLITDVLHSFIPLVPHELGGSLRLSEQMVPSRS